MNILGHTSFIGNSGYANHARSFFTNLNKHHFVKIRNSTIGESWKGFNKTPHNGENYITEDMKNMLYQQTLFNKDNTHSDFPIYSFNENFKPDVHIVLAEMNHYYFYDNYIGYKIAYNVWETTRYPDDFFKRLFYFDEVWVPTKWQKDCLLEQGFPEKKISVVTEGVDINVFKPKSNILEKDKFRFLLFGRWEYRKSTREIIKTFGETFKDKKNVELICSVENPFPFDGFKTTEERIKNYNLIYDNVKYINFLPREEYVKYLQEGDVFVSCSRSEGWNLPLNESLSCGTPSLYSNWGGQLEFAEGLGIPVDIVGLKVANIERKEFPGEYCEPDFDDLSKKMIDVYENYEKFKEKALEESKEIHRNFNWDIVTKKASDILNKNVHKKTNDFVFITCGNKEYMNIIEKLVKSINFFSKHKIIVYGVNCEVPFDYPNLIKKTLTPPKYSEHDKWYWKQYSCIESIEEGYDNYVWIDGDVIVNYNIDNIKEYFKNLENYPLSDIHVQDEFFGLYDGQKQLFNEKLSEYFNLNKKHPILHVCMFIYNKRCKWWFEEIIQLYKTLPLDRYKELLMWNDEGVHNFLMSKYNFTEHLPLSSFDTSDYEIDKSEVLNNFYKFWLEEGPQNFNKIYGYQFIPKDKDKILYFHGNKDLSIAENIIDFIKLKQENSFFISEYFFTDVYKLKNLGEIKNVEGGTLEIANKFGWDYAIYHEIYNLEEYYLDRIKLINNGDIVVDLGGNIGIFNRWAYSQGASKVISFEPDKRYFKLLELNSHPNSILFNAAMSNEMGETILYESNHLGGSTTQIKTSDTNSYKVRTYNLDYLFESKLIDKIDFLKIDTEGAEINILGGISNENLQKINNISLEYHHSHLGYNEELRNNLISRLNKNGFSTFLLMLGNNNSLQMLYANKIKNNKMTKETLDSFGVKNGTDKSSVYHNFCVKYEKYLPFNREDKLKILEIGVLRGNSLRTWRDYFINSEIIGIDIDPSCEQYNENRIKIEIGSQTDIEFLEYVINKHGPFDMILDDGSHINSDVIFSFENLFHSLKEHGVYIVEDAVTSYWEDYGGGLTNPNRTIEYFKTIIDDVNYRGLYNVINGHVHCREEKTLTEYSNEVQPDCITDIESINFMNSIILITKK